jgi:hypothetical protein
MDGHYIHFSPLVLILLSKNWLGEISEERLLIDAKEIGEVSISPRVVVDTEDVSFVKVLDSIYFRRGEFISYIYMQYAYGETPVISIIELGKIIDNKIIDVLDQ